MGKKNEAGKSLSKHSILYEKQTEEQNMHF